MSVVDRCLTPSTVFATAQSDGLILISENGHDTLRFGHSEIIMPVRDGALNSRLEDLLDTRVSADRRSIRSSSPKV